MKSYQKVLTLGHRYIDSILIGRNHAEEKIDGSQFNFWIENSELVCKSRSADICNEMPPNLFVDAVNYLLTIKDKLIPNYYYHGEVLASKRHNVLSYNRIPKHNIIIFDIEDEYGNPFEYDEKAKLASDLDLETVRKLGDNISTKDEIVNLLNNTSALGGVLIEGVVIKNYDRLTPSGNYMVGKLVSEKFKEVHRKKYKSIDNRSIVQKLIEELKTKARWDKSILHLKERGLLENTPKDIGILIKEIIKDVEEEELEYIRNKLYNYYIKDIRKSIISGFPEYYKYKILDNIKEKDENN